MKELNILEREQVQYSFLNTKTFEIKKHEGPVHAERVEGLHAFLWQGKKIGMKIKLVEQSGKSRRTGQVTCAGAQITRARATEVLVSSPCASQ